MTKPQQRLDNARNPQQLAKMLACAAQDICYLCRTDFETRHEAPIEKEGAHWFVTRSTAPYDTDSRTSHYMVISVMHVLSFQELSAEAKTEWFEMIDWLVAEKNLDGYTVMSRNGNMARTGASIDHLHTHVVRGAEKQGHTLEQSILATIGYKHLA